MKFAEINKKFTEKVAEYIAKGYYFNTATMSGHQGEVGKVDLTDGKEIIRITLERMSGVEGIDERHPFWYRGVELVVGKSADNVKPNKNSTMDIIWTNKLEVIYKEQFYQVDDNADWYVTRDEAFEAYNLRRERRRSRYTFEDKVFPEEAKNAVVSFMKRQPRCKGVRVQDITKVIKKTRVSMFSEEEKIQYIVECKGKTYKLH